MRPCAIALALLALGGACRKTAPVRPDEKPKPTPTAPAAEAPWFTDVAEGSGVDFVHDSGADGDFWFPEVACGGTCLIDFDSDGRLDLYFVSGGNLDPGAPRGTENRLYRNLGGWKFEDVTAAAGVQGGEYGMGCTVGDFDNDADSDLYVTNFGPNILYRNDGGGRFTDVTAAAGVAEPSWSSSAAVSDLDDDGDLDLFVANYVHWTREAEKSCFSSDGARDYCSPKSYKAPARDTLYMNRGDGTFEDVSVKAGLPLAFGNGLGVVCADLDGDTKVDLYVANDGTPNQLWINQGGMKFVDRAMLAGAAVDQHGWANAGMGVQAVDVDQDGALDLFVVHLEEEKNRLFRNMGGSFQDATDRFNVGTPSVGFTGFGMGFADFDHDGWLDLHVANGRVKRPTRGELHGEDPYAEMDQLYRGLPDAKLAEVLPRGGIADQVALTGRGSAYGDLDDDGDVDVVVANRDGRPHLLRNDAGSRGSWVGFELTDVSGRDAIGATVLVEAGGRKFHRLAHGSYSYLASNDPRVHVGLGASEKVDSVTIRWPDGTVDTLGPFEARKVHVIKRGAAK